MHSGVPLRISKWRATSNPSPNPNPSHSPNPSPNPNPDPNPSPNPNQVIARRARTFRNQSIPVVEALEGRGLLRKLDGSGDADAVFALASAAFEPFAKS